MLGGDLRQVLLPSVLAFLEAEKKTGELLVLGMRAGRLWLRNGQPIGVSLEGERLGSPMDRMMEFLDLTQGRFEFVGGDPPDTTDALGTTVTALLLEHARRKDEARARP
jgi:hypothetical protein